MQTVVHVTHEAIHKVGGIGAVLQGMLTSRVFLEQCPRNILVGPYWPSDEPAEDRLGSHGEVLYSGQDQLYRSPLAARFREIEQAFGVSLVYGRRRFVDKDTGVTSSAEVVLIDVTRFDQGRVGQFKFKLWDKFGLSSAQYEHIWDYELWVRLAEPAIAALHALGAAGHPPAAGPATAAAAGRADAGGHDGPCVVLSHEYMGVPTALAAILDGGNFRTIFHAHECATVRKIVEGHPGHDTMFYNVMRAALAEGKYLDDVFGDQSSYYRHALVRAARFFDGIFAVGDHTLAEMRFLGADFAHVDAHVAYNGVPHWAITVDDKMASRRKLRAYCRTLLDYEPDYVFTHVTRLVPSKGLWRDLRVLEHVEHVLRDRGESAVMFALSTEVPARRPEDVRRMEAAYHWPVVHHEGLPDLSHGEAIYYAGVQEFNARSRNVKVVFVNQFGWDRERCGTRMPTDMEFMDIRKGSDAEFGQSIYEPFGIAQVEPISFGGICVYTNVCGCGGFVARAAGGPTPNVIVADYTNLGDRGGSVEQLLHIGRAERDVIEDREAARVARELVARLPRTPAEFEAFIRRGFDLASKMSWDAVARDYLLLGFQRAAKAKRLQHVG